MRKILFVAVFGIAGLLPAESSIENQKLVKETKNLTTFANFYLVLALSVFTKEITEDEKLLFIQKSLNNLHNKCVTLEEMLCLNK